MAMFFNLFLVLSHQKQKKRAFYVDSDNSLLVKFFRRIVKKDKNYYFNQKFDPKSSHSIN